MLRITGLGCDHAIQVGMRISVRLRVCVPSFVYRDTACVNSKKRKFTQQRILNETDEKNTQQKVNKPLANLCVSVCVSCMDIMSALTLEWVMDRVSTQTRQPPHSYLMA